MQTTASAAPQRGTLTLHGIVHKKPKAAQAPTPASTKPVGKKAHELVKMKNGARFVLIFSCPQSFVRAGIQTPPAGGGSGGGEKNEVPGGIRFEKVAVDLDGLMARCLVEQINVREKNGFCQVYVNCVVGAVDGNLGFHFWHNSYEKFVRREMLRVWNHGALQEHSDGHTSLKVKKPHKGAAQVKLKFAIED